MELKLQETLLESMVRQFEAGKLAWSRELFPQDALARAAMARAWRWRA